MVASAPLVALGCRYVRNKTRRQARSTGLPGVRPRSHATRGGPAVSVLERAAVAPLRRLRTSPAMAARASSPTAAWRVDIPIGRTHHRPSFDRRRRLSGDLDVPLHRVGRGVDRALWGNPGRTKLPGTVARGRGARCRIGVSVESASGRSRCWTPSSTPSPTRRHAGLMALAFYQWLYEWSTAFMQAFRLTLGA